MFSTIIIIVLGINFISNLYAGIANGPVSRGV